MTPKTLKDLEAKRFGSSIYAHYSEKELKKVAINEIKELRIAEKYMHPNNTDRLIEGKWCQMMYFFNITEEDLE